MAINEKTLAARARRSYELGRLGMALDVGWVVAAMVAVSIAGCRQPMISLWTGALLLTVAVGLRWRGAPYGASVVPGLAAGAVPLLLPILVGQLGHVCVGGICMSLCGPACIFSGMVAGMVLGLRAVRFGRGWGAFAGSGVVVAGLTGALGCALGGLSGVLGMAGGVLIGIAPPVLGKELKRSM